MSRPGTNIRELEQKLRDKHKAGSLTMFADRIGARVSVVHATALEMADELDKMARQRRPRPAFWDSSCRGLAKLLREAVEVSKAT